MTTEIALLFGILAVSLFLLIGDFVRMDLLALLALGALALTGLVTPEQALAGFSRPAVITIWAFFIVGGGLSRSGLASQLGRTIIRIAGQTEGWLILGIMLTAGLLSGFMSNVGVVALLLPVVMDIARRTGQVPSKLLIPLAYGSLLGGLTTLIGTPTSLLVDQILAAQGWRHFQVFEFAPLGLASLLAGALFMASIGRRFLPIRHMQHESVPEPENHIEQLYDMDERLFGLRIPPGSHLSGKTILESRFGAALGLNVIAINRQSRVILSPDPSLTLEGGDKLIVEGRIEALRALQAHTPLVLAAQHPPIEWLRSPEARFVEVVLAPDSGLVGRTLFESDLRQRYPINVLAISHEGGRQRTNLQDRKLMPGDRLLMQVSLDGLDRIQNDPDWERVRVLSAEEADDLYHLEARFRLLRIPDNSGVDGKSLAESRLADAYGIAVIGILRNGQRIILPGADEVLHAGDELIVEVLPRDLQVLKALRELEILDREIPSLDKLQSPSIGLVEAVLSPHSTLTGKTLRELHFREKYGLSVLAIWRAGRPYRSGLRDIALRLGDALLLYGPRSNLRMLGLEPDFIVLTQEAQEMPRREKAPYALAVMAVILVPAIFQWLPIAIAALVGASLMVLWGVLSMEEAYRAIDWKTVFLIAGMLPLGTAMEQTGAADLLARQAVGLVGSFGPQAIMAVFFLLAAAISQIMPNPAVAVLMTPIALSAAMELGLSGPAMAVVIAAGASAGFLSPVAHPSNSLVMGAGGYRFLDYTKAGVALLLILMIVTILLVPLLWPA